MSSDSGSIHRIATSSHFYAHEDSQEIHCSKWKFWVIKLLKSIPLIKRVFDKYLLDAEALKKLCNYDFKDADEQDIYSLKGRLEHWKPGCSEEIQVVIVSEIRSLDLVLGNRQAELYRRAEEDAQRTAEIAVARGEIDLLELELKSAKARLRSAETGFEALSEWCNGCQVRITNIKSERDQRVALAERERDQKLARLSSCKAGQAEQIERSFQDKMVALEQAFLAEKRKLEQTPSGEFGDSALLATLRKDDTRGVQNALSVMEGSEEDRQKAHALYAGMKAQKREAANLCQEADKKNKIIALESGFHCKKSELKIAKMESLGKLQLDEYRDKIALEDVQSAFNKSNTIILTEFDRRERPYRRELCHTSLEAKQKGDEVSEQTKVVADIERKLDDAKQYLRAREGYA